MTSHDLDALLRSLPRHDVDPRVGERIRRQATKDFHGSQSLRVRPLIELVGGSWRWLEPALSTGIVGTYLAWMVWTLAGFAR